jgi:TM2 domain-containing membrane protein YozV
MAPVAWSAISLWPTQEFVDPDYMVRPVVSSPTALLVILIVSSAVTLWSLWKSFASGKPTRPRAVSVGIFAAYCGATYAVVTAPTYGANIGGAFMVLGVLPVAIGSGISFARTIRPPKARKSRSAALVLAILLGAYGAHRFYMGHKARGWVMLLTSVLTCGVLVPLMLIIGWVEAYMLWSGRFRFDDHGKWVSTSKHWR